MIMAIKSFRAPVAIAAASWAATGAVVLALSPAARADDQWGSCAVPANPTAAASSSAFCSANPYPDQASAESRALAMCNYLKNRGCSVAISYTTCGAVASNGLQWTGASGPTQQAAEAAATGQLVDSTVFKSACIVAG
jgi:uncharacterized protein DUF4189